MIYTHSHADHILGIDDLRPLSFRHKPGRLPLYARPDVVDFIRKMFRYIFDADYKFGGLPQVELKPIDGPPLLETMFDLPTYEGVEEVVVNAEVVEGRAQPLMIYAERRDTGGAA